MTSEEVPELNKLLGQLDHTLRRMQGETKNLGETLEAIVKLCEDEPELLRVINRERGYLSGLKRAVDDFPLIRQLKRRLPIVEAKIREQERAQNFEDEQVRRQAQDVRDSLQDVLRRFLR